MTLSTLEQAVALTGVLLAALFFVLAPANAVEIASHRDADVARLFANDSLLAVTIEAPLTTLMKDRPDEQYLEGTFSFTGDDGEEKTVDLKLRTRGKYRRQEKHCDFAPIRLKVPADVPVEDVNLVMQLEALSFAITQRRSGT